MDPKGSCHISVEGSSWPLAVLLAGTPSKLTDSAKVNWLWPSAEDSATFASLGPELTDHTADNLDFADALKIDCPYGDEESFLAHAQPERSQGQIPSDGTGWPFGPPERKEGSLREP